MSNAMAEDAKIKDYQGPFFFSEALGGLQEIYGKRKEVNQSEYIVMSTFKSFGYEIPGFLDVGQLRTTDGYRWLLVMKFEFEMGRISILFPYNRDSACEDGTYSDRHIAIYTRGMIDGGIVNYIVSCIYNRLRNLVERNW